MSQQYVEVALPPPLARELTYRIPPDLREDIQPGSLVVVPVVQRLMTGIALGFVDPPDPAGKLREEDIRDLSQVLAGDALLDPELIDLCRWMADYYFAPLGSALTVALPPGLQLTSNRLVRLGDDRPAEPVGDLETRVLEQLQASGPLKVTTLQHRLGRPGLENALRRLRHSGQVEIVPLMEGPPVRRELHVGLADRERAEAALPTLERRARRQAACLKFVLERGPLPRKTLLEQGFSAAVLRQLHQRNLFESIACEVLRDPLAHIEAETPEPLQLTADQQQVLDVLGAALDQQQFYPALLQGVTGSGKTLVYIHAAARVLEQGRGVIVLVPEIALAWQVVRRFKAHFGDTVAVLHSQLSAGERYDTWRRLHRGEQRLVIGARSAVLAPVRHLGLIVVDEEHDTSYKQEDLEGRHPLPYNARDLAIMRAQKQGAVALLGSATPSLESYWNARTCKYHLLTLPRRVDDRPLPEVEVVDMRREPFQRKERAIFSQVLRLKITQRLARGEKTVLLQNRRGFSPIILCTSCGEAVQCPNCRVSLTYHRGREPELRCHYCDGRRPVPQVCPSCGGAQLRFEGIGTQRVEDALLEQFPGIRVIRMDVDTTASKGAHDQFVEGFRQGQADVLVGTQMVAKGLDFPAVTLVGVISADTGMHLPDFRAAERSFQLLTQVAGRSGRGPVPGEVVIQTLLPENPVLQNAAAQQFETFADRELEERREAGFPPFGRLIVFRWRGRDEEVVERVARQGAADLGEQLRNDAALLGPAPAPLARLRGHYRWQALLSGASAPQIHGLTARALPAMRQSARRESVTLTVDVDPLTMM